MAIEKGARLSRFIVKAEVGTTRHLFEMSVARRMPEDRRGREREIEREKVCLCGSLGIFSVFFGLLKVALRSSLLHSVLFGLPILVRVYLLLCVLRLFVCLSVCLSRG